MTDRFARSFDVDAVNGPEWPRIARDHFDMIARALEDLHERVDETEEADDSGSTRFHPRIVIDTPVATPRQLTWEEAGSRVGDEGMTEASGVTLPIASEYPGDRATECPVFYFVLTTAFPMTIFVGDAAVDTLEIGSGAGGVTSFKLTVDGDTVKFALHDDRWRVAS